LTERGENAAQIVDRRGHIVDATVTGRSAPFLNRKQLARAYRHTIVVNGTLSTSDGEQQQARFLATPVNTQDARLIAVVAASLEPKQQALDDLRRQLSLGGPIVLLIAAMVGYFAAAAALRPVESMRKRAEDIGGDSSAGQRLPVPPSNDEVSRLGKTLNEMLGRLEDSLARERAFVADASHELRMPLAILKGEVELALRHAKTAPQFRKAVASAAEETDRVVQLAEDLLVIARSDQGELPVRREDVDLAQLVSSTVERFALRASEQRVELEFDAPQGAVVNVDALRVEQALGNLIENALRYGGHSIHIAASSYGSAGCEFAVTDDGDGFSDEFLPHALERFTRGDTARGRGGTGLGLSIVEAIAHAHGGSVMVFNGADHGARVQLFIPGPAL
jgi:signal transduction histidine kinase